MAQKKSLEKTETLQDEPTISICDVMHTNANSVIEKMESLLPANMEMYSDFYTEWLHSLQDLFGACNIAENEILSNMWIDQKALQSFETYFKMSTKAAITQIEMANRIQQTYMQAQISSMKTLDMYIHLMLGHYSKMLSGSLEFINRSRT
ncbi:MAG TPA: hypothetical protein VJ771_04540 [Candidatus Nitrosotalea sp.]|nr:hypothetical protein [Candidatus Nitrosotalea sp.]